MFANNVYQFKNYYKDKIELNIEMNKIICKKKK